MHNRAFSRFARKEVLILAASTDTGPAYEGFRGHGLFAYNLLDALQNADADNNGLMEVSELAAYTYSQVLELSEQVFNLRQVPQVRITGANYPIGKPTPVSVSSSPRISAGQGLLNARLLAEEYFKRLGTARVQFASGRGGDLFVADIRIPRDSGYSCEAGTHLGRTYISPLARKLFTMSHPNALVSELSRNDRRTVSEMVVNKNWRLCQ